MKKNEFKENKIITLLKEYVSYLAVIVLIVAIASVNPRFLSLGNISNILSDLSPLLIMSIGVTFVLLMGSIDLSIGAICSCSGVIFAVFLMEYGWVGILIAILFGAAAGACSGFLYVNLKIPSFIATFGTMGIWTSMALIIAGGGSKQIAKPFWDYIAWHKIKLGIIPLPFLIAVAILIIFIVIEKNTKFGRTIFAIGGNEIAARTAGLDINRTKMTVYILVGVFSAIAGIFVACNLKSGIPTVGVPYTLNAIAAVALGGTSLSGGKGGLIKTFAGVLLVILIQNGMQVVGVDVFWQKIVFGSIILVSLAVTTDRKRRNLTVS